jgi:hypothetical protein
MMLINYQKSAFVGLLYIYRSWIMFRPMNYDICVLGWLCITANYYCYGGEIKDAWTVHVIMVETMVIYRGP